MKKTLQSKDKSTSRKHTVFMIFKILSSLFLFFLMLMALPSFIIAISRPRSSIGSIILILGVIVFLFLWWRPGLRKKFKSKKWIRRIYRVCTAVFTAGSLFALVLSLLIISAMGKTPPEGNVTVIVLGCQVHGTSPSLMLVERLNAAADYLIENPSAKCIVSGGQGPGESIPEAIAMQTYLIEKGIDTERIYIEPESVNTEANISLSAGIISQNGLSADVAIATDSFHQYRSHHYAKNNDLAPYSINSATPWWMYTGYFSREVLALGRTLIFGG